MEKFTDDDLNTKIEVYTKKQICEGINCLIFGIKRPDFAPLAEICIKPQEVPSLLDGLEHVVVKLRQQDRRELSLLDILADDVRREIDAEVMADLYRTINLEEALDEFVNEDHLKPNKDYEVKNGI